jgi:hypothetical protein
MINPRAKGQRAERELIEEILGILQREKDIRYDKRGLQTQLCGGKGQPDIQIKGLTDCEGGLHIESKNQKNFSFFAWIKKLLEDTLGTRRIPTLAYKCPANKNPAGRTKEWYITYRLSDTQEYIQAWLRAGLEVKE